jgi:hypothetical protein
MKHFNPTKTMHVAPIVIVNKPVGVDGTRGNPVQQAPRVLVSPKPKK